MSEMTLTVNGQTHTVDVDPETPLLYVLSDDLGLRGPKFGCGLGQCGACVGHRERSGRADVRHRRQPGRGRDHHDARGTGDATRSCTRFSARSSTSRPRSAGFA